MQEKKAHVSAAIEHTQSERTLDWHGDEVHGMLDLFFQIVFSTGPLSVMDLALPPRHGSDLRVAYQVSSGS